MPVETLSRRQNGLKERADKGADTAREDGKPERYKEEENGK